jgi:S-adenosylmethionine:tRNA ribosyltransferase-isomerase
LKRSELDYRLPDALIAQHPLQPRDASRLLVLHRAAKRVEHRVFRQLPALLQAGSVLVLNDTRVVPAKIAARRQTGGRVDGLFLRELNIGRWLVLLEGRGRLKVGEQLKLGGDHTISLIERRDRGAWEVAISPAQSAEAVLAAVGRTPLPPYIRRKADPADPEDAADRQRYQTVYADRPGAVAAPTAGLHFTDAVFARLAERGIEVVRVTLHVGLGTFAPVTVEELAAHRMHAEWYELPPEAADRINAARAAGRPIVAVGTTAVRVLETRADQTGALWPGSGWTDLFITPGYQFRSVDALVTNFHLPGSTLLALVYAFAGVELMRRVYDEAIRDRYRFYSYGDAMLIL